MGQNIIVYIHKCDLIITIITCIWMLSGINLKMCMKVTININFLHGHKGGTFWLKQGGLYYDYYLQLLHVFECLVV